MLDLNNEMIKKANKKNKVLYDQQSEHQHIMVLDTTEFGKLLVLDGQANLAESDLVYTTTLMGGGTEDFKDKQVDHY